MARRVRCFESCGRAVGLDLVDEFLPKIEYTDLMSDTDQPKTAIEQRLSAIEAEVKTIHSQLADIREIISSGYDVLFDSNHRRAEITEAIIDRLERVEEKLTPTFLKVFPRHNEFLGEIDNVLRPRRESGG